MKEKNNLFRNKKILIISGVIISILIISIIVVLSSNKLNYVENQTFDILVEFIETGEFYNPKEVRLLDAVIRYEYDNNKREYGNEVEDFYVKISGTNKVSGTINKCYHIYYYNGEFKNRKEDCEDIYKTGKSYEQLSRKSIKNINNALKDYWDDLGL